MHIYCEHKKKTVVLQLSQSQLFLEISVLADEKEYGK